MAGWSKIVDGSALDCFKTYQNLEKNELCYDPESGSKGSVKGDKQDKLRFIFNQFLSVFVKEIYESDCFRPIPPMLGDGQSVDLFALYLVVRRKGGYETVTKNALWDLVAKESGYDSSVGSAVKLIYIKYLDALDRWLQRIVKDKDSKGGLEESSADLGEFSMDLESDIRGFLLEISDQKKKDGEYLHLDLKKSETKLFTGDEVQSCVESNGGNGNASDDKITVDDCKDSAVVDSSLVKEDDSSRKRKRECYSGMLDWVTRVAKDPFDTTIGSLPERSKWKYYGSEQLWKRVMLVREAMLLKRTADSSSALSIWQKNYRMHPAIYDDDTGSDKSRCSQRVLPARESRRLLSLKKSKPGACSETSSSGTQSDSEDHDKQSEPAEVPEWTGETCESDSKWLGTRVWPLEKGEHKKHQIERDRIGKGRQDSCGCEFAGSLECVRFHVGEKRMKVKLELGSAFYHWKFDKMGEEVALSWTKDEEKKFQGIVRSNPSSLDKCFWHAMFKHFRKRSREELVSYYFNVFLLQRRGYQNRSTPCNVDSDDDESEFASLTKALEQETVKSTGSVLSSPKKTHSNFT